MQQPRRQQSRATNSQQKPNEILVHSSSSWFRGAYLLELSTLRREHELNQFFGDLRLKAFSVSLVDPHDIGNDSSVFAVRIHGNLSLARRRRKSPRGIRRVLASAVVDVAGFRVDDFFGLAASSAIILRGPLRFFRQSFLIHLTLACCEDE